MSAAVSVSLIKLIPLKKTLMPHKMKMKFLREFVLFTLLHYENLCLRNDWLRNLSAVWMKKEQ